MYKVGELAKATGVKEGTIRFYEKCGFLENSDSKRKGVGRRFARRVNEEQWHICKDV